jgi:hypothetical protein
MSPGHACWLRLVGAELTETQGGVSTEVLT